MSRKFPNFSEIMSANGAAKHFFEFDEFRVEVEERRLLQNGLPVALASRDLDILLALIQNAGNTVDKNDLMETVWEDTFVEEGNLNRHVSTLRKLLGDDPKEQRFIKTIPKRGYRFTADVREIVEQGDTVTIESASRSKVIITEETTEGFWTTSRFAIAGLLIVALAGIVWLGIPRNSAVNSSSVVEMRGTSDAEAFELYTNGRALWQTRNAADLHKATLLLEQAVAKDPNFALAHAALADAYAFDYQNRKKAEATANEAIRLDPDLGEPHATLGFIRMLWEWRLRDAEAEFKRAVALSPDYATARQWFALNLAATGHGGAALAEVTRALTLVPDSVPINADLCQILYLSKRYDEAIAQCRKVIERDPNNANAHALLYDIYNAAGLYSEAVESYYRYAQANSSPWSPADLNRLRAAFRNGGIHEYWNAHIAINNSTPSRRAQHYARLGDSRNALASLEEAYEKRDFDLAMFFADPTFDALRDDPRFQNLGCRVARQNVNC